MNHRHYQTCKACPAKEKCVYMLLNPEQKNKLEAKKMYCEKKKGTVLYHEGFHASSFIMLIEGIVKKTKNVKSEEETIINFSKEGDLIGLNASGSNTVYQNSAIAFTDVKFCMLSHTLLTGFFKENTAVCNHLANCFSAELAGICKRMISLMYGNAQNRMAEALLLLQKQMKPGECCIVIGREDLAALTGITRETVSRVLSKFNKGKLISFDKKCIIIEKSDKLQALAKRYSTLFS